MLSYPAYPEYSHDGFPIAWDRKRLRFALKMNPSKNEIALGESDLVSFVPMDAVGEYGGIRLNEERELNEIGSGYTYFRDGDVVVAKITPCFENGKGALAKGLTNRTAFGTTELHVMRANCDLLEPCFLFYLTISDLFRKIGESEMYGAGGQKRVPETFFKDFRAGLPSHEEQLAIICFLQFKTAQIDDLIKKKESLLDKLAEKRTALINNAVTKGLDPSVPMRKSGVAWLGSIPAHWKLLQLKYAVTFQRGHDLPADARSEGVIPLVSSSGISSSHDVAIAKGPGIVTGRYGTIGKFTYIDSDYWPLNTTLYSVDTHGNNTKYLWFMMHLLSDLFVMESRKGAVPGVDRNDLHPVLTAIPPKAEQDAIVSRLESATLKLDQQAAKVIEVIERLQEYRATLITNAVTGKIDVRGFEVPQTAGVAAS
jgi:type I restriction enzyme S subunit